MEDENILDHSIKNENDPDEMYELAGVGKRFSNYLIDSSVVYMVWHLVTLMTLQFYELNESTLLFLYAILLCIYLSYYILCEALMGKTVGKMISGTLVVDEDGYKASFGRIVLRNICRFIPFEAFSYLFGSPIGWHDLLSKTRVVTPAKSGT